MLDIVNILNQIDNFMYFPILIIVMALSGLYFTTRTKGVQIRLFPESVRLLLEPSGDENAVSSLQVSTASRVGTGNIIGVSTAICLGGPGACFWMWVMCIIGASSAFMESTLAQIFKRKDENGHSYGGPAYYIEEGIHKPKIAILFLHLSDCDLCIRFQSFMLLQFTVNIHGLLILQSFHHSTYHRRFACTYNRILPFRRRQEDSQGYKYNCSVDGCFLCHSGFDCDSGQLCKYSCNVCPYLPGCF